MRLHLILRQPFRLPGRNHYENREAKFPAGSFADDGLSLKIRMNIKSIGLKVKRLRDTADWKLLLFLLLFLNVKLAVKIPVLILMCLFRFNFRFGFSLRNSRLPLFYLLIPCIGLLSALALQLLSADHYVAVLLTGVAFWIICLLAAHQVKLAVERNEPAVVHQTILLFFLINALFSLVNFGLIVLETHTINPYTYQGQYQKYFIGTGDYIKGVTFDTSTTNAILNAFGLMYFLIRNNALMVCLCMVILLLTGSNFVNLTLLFILALLFIFRSTRDQKSLIVICLAFLVIFMTRVSPQNNAYVTETIRYVFHQKGRSAAVAPAAPLRLSERPDSTLTAEEKKDKIAMLYLDSVFRVNQALYWKRNALRLNKSLVISEGGRINIPQPDINSAPYQSLVTTPPEQRQLLRFVQQHADELPISGDATQWTSLPGKAQGLLQTIHLFREHPSRLIAGEGMGNFSSKLAFRVSGLGITGGFPAKYAYISHDFLVNHLDLYLSFFSRRAGLHSLTNSPFSVYDQLLAEYGLLGILTFGLFYVWYFARHRKILSYGLPILGLTLLLLGIDYWFEQLSVLVFFELLLFLDIRESSAATV